MAADVVVVVVLIFVAVIVNHGNYSNKQHAWPIVAYTLSLSNNFGVSATGAERSVYCGARECGGADGQMSGGGCV